MKQVYSVTKLNAFFKEIADLTFHHDEIDGNACVTADRLGEALEKVDTEWLKNTKGRFVDNT